MKMYEFRLKFHLNLFLRVQITKFQHCFRWWLGAVQATSHYLKQWWLYYRRIYASRGLDELRQQTITWTNVDPNRCRQPFHQIIHGAWWITFTTIVWIIFKSNSEKSFLCNDDCQSMNAVKVYNKKTIIANCITPIKWTRLCKIH